jgi:hypothetical protein
MRRMKLNRRMKIAVAVAAVSVVATTASTATFAQAAGVSCGNKEVCFFKDTGLNGQKIARSADLGFAFNVDPLNDRVSSIWNNSNYRVAVYQDPQQNRNNGKCAIIGPHTRLDTIGWWNDRISMVEGDIGTCNYGATRRNIP